MSIEALIEVAPPPAEPDEAFDGPWEPIEAEIGAVLPQDYKDFVRLYGSGLFMCFLTVNVPRCRSPYVRLEREVRTVNRLFSQDEEFVYALWPNRGGLIAFGRTDFGDYLFWIPYGPPETWKVVVWGRGLGTFEVFDCGLTDFLTGVAKGEIDPREFPEYEPPYDPYFQPFSVWESVTRPTSIEDERH
jgi:hypothetical protein